ncbi:hypothetical protein BSLG_000602 [Batrachochytrium salamandrivorans]|nr:hypothetical protein BSLG_000602 [Batrachochytrium salamandrivorans]
MQSDISLHQSAAAADTLPHGRGRSVGSQILSGSKAVSPTCSKMSVATAVGDSMEALSSRKNNWESRISRSLGNMLDSVGSTSRDRNLDKQTDPPQRTTRSPVILEDDLVIAASKSAGVSEDSLQKQQRGDLLAQSSQGASHRTNYIAYSSLSNSVSPIVRSRSGFALHMLSMCNRPDMDCLGSEVIPARLIGNIGATSVPAIWSRPATPENHKSSSSGNDTTSHSRAATGALSKVSNMIRRSSDSIGLPEEDGFLKDIEIKGFSGIWNHAITRQENYYFLRMDTIEYRNHWFSMTAATRVSAAKRIYAAYLSPTHTVFSVRWQNTMTDPSVEDVIQVITASLESPSATTFDDISYVAMQALENIYSDSYVPLDYDLDLLASSHSSRAVKFKKSAFYQAMRNDLCGTLHLTTVQHARVVERLADLSNIQPLDPLIWDKIYTSLDSICLDSDSTVAKSIQTAKKNTALLLTQNGFNRAWSVSSLREEDHLFSSTKIPRSGLQAVRTFDSPEVSHTFLPSSVSDSILCEYCCIKLAFDKGTEDCNSAYRCETCGYICHRNCRSQVHVTCMRTSAAVDLDMSAEVHSEKIRLVAEKLGALEKEVDIEMKIRDGLEKITKAKQAGGVSVEHDVISQLERNTKRLAALKHEMQKRRLQLQNLQATVVPVLPPPTPLELSSDSVKLTNDDAINVQYGQCLRTSHGGSAGLSRSMNLATIPAIPGHLKDTDEVQDGGLIRVLIEDPATKTESKKAIYISENQSTIEVIERILEKANLAGIPTAFELSYTSADGERILVKDEDRPLQLEHVDFSIMFFKISRREERLPRDMNNPLLKKQREILMEIYESEMNYSQDLKLIAHTFLRQFDTSGLLDLATLETIFSNIEEICTIHESLFKELTDVTSDGSYQAANMIKCFTDNVSQFKCYHTYCGNQHSARRMITKLSSDPAFLKLVQKCESNPKLHKLSLADMLVKPMHRITRYPLLFKRLLPNLGTDSSEYVALNGLLAEIDGVISRVNETIKRREHAFRINQLDEILDFGVISERFKIAIDNRELISEKPLMYFKKTSNIPIDAVVFLFSDMVLIVKIKRSDHLQLLKPPIPLEAVVLLDKPDGVDKNMFQITHLDVETHLMQAFSSYDKNMWLQEAEVTRAQFSSAHYDLESAYLRMQTERYRHMNLTRRSPGEEDRLHAIGGPADHESVLQASGISKNRRRISDTSTKQQLVFNDIDQLRSDDVTIKRQLSLLQVFRSRKQEEPTSPQLQQETSGFGQPSRNSSKEYTRDHMHQAGNQQIDEPSALSMEVLASSLPLTRFGSGGTPISVMRNDTRTSCKGGSSDAIGERGESRSASSSPNMTESQAPTGTKGRLGRKLTASKIITNIFRMTSPSQETKTDKAMLVKERMSLVLGQVQTSVSTTAGGSGSSDQLPLPATTNAAQSKSATEVMQMVSFDIDSLLAEGGTPENVSAIHQQVEKKKNVVGVIGKVRRSLKPVKSPGSPSLG